MTFDLTTHRVWSNIGELFSANVAARGVSAITLILTARLLGPDGYGPYAASLSMMRMAAVLFALGLDTWLLRGGGNDLKRLQTRMTAAFVIEVFFGLLWLIGVWVVSLVLKHESFPPEVLLLCAGSVFFEELLNTAVSAFKAMLRNKITFLLMVGSQGLFLGATLLLIRLGGETAVPFLWGRLSVMVSSAVLSLFVLSRLVGFRLDVSELKRALQETRAFGASVALGTVSRQADVTIVAALLGKTAVGLYAPAITLTSTLFLAPAAMYGVMLPVFGQAYEKSAHAVLPAARKMLRNSLGLGVAVSLLVWITAKPLVVFIYGPNFASSGQILQILSAILLFRFLSFTLAAVLAAVHWQMRRVWVQIIAVTINIGGNLIVIQRGGLTAVAWVYVFTEAILMLGYYFWFNRWQRQQLTIVHTPIS